MKIGQVKDELTRLLREMSDQPWHTFEVVLKFPPFINKGYKATPLFSDLEGKTVGLSVKWDNSFTETVLSFIFKANQQSDCNQIRYSVKNGNFEDALIVLEFNQAIVDSFEANLPKKMRGRTIPWWKNPDETSGLDKD